MFSKLMQSSKPGSSKSESGVCVCVWIRGENSKEAPNKGHADTRRIITLRWFTFSIPTLMARQNSGVSVIGRAENVTRAEPTFV